MPRSHHSLHIPDHPSWRHEFGYSPTIARALKEAYALVHASSVLAGGVLRAYQFIREWLRVGMSRRQRLHIFYLLAMAHATVGDYPLALMCVDEALDIAASLEDNEDCIELLFFRASLYRATLRFRAGVADLWECLDLLHQQSAQQSASGTPSDAPFELAVVTQLAGYEFFLSRYLFVDRLLAEARLLVRFAPAQRLEAAMIPWLEAHRERWDEHPERAVSLGRAAATVYSREGSPTSAGRIRIFLTEALLDQAAAMPIGSEYDRVLRRAERELRTAERLTLAGHDPIGIEMTRLVRARLSLLAHENVDRQKLIEAVARTAAHLDDEAVLAQAMTALGNELAARGEREPARDAFRQAIGILDGSDVPALAYWPQVGLARLRAEA